MEPRGRNVGWCILMVTYTVENKGGEVENKGF